MPVYRYEALDDRGHKVAGVLTAPDEPSARARVRGMGHFPTALEPGTEEVQVRFGLSRSRVSDRDLAGVTRLLGTLLGAGFPVVEALATLANQSAQTGMTEVLHDVRTRVQEGGKLSSAMESHPDVFPNLYVQMVRAGETGAALEQVLNELAAYLEVRAHVRNKLRAALAYPAIMTLVGTVMLTFLVAWVVPTMADVLTAGGRKLPLITRLLLWSGDLVLGWWWTAPFLLFGAVTGWRMALATVTGRAWADRAALDLPVLGDLTLKMTMARFARLLGVLLSAGVPVLRALEIVQAVVENVHIAGALETARIEVARGASLADPLRSSGLFPPLVVDMVAAGQASGKLTQTLARLAEGYDNEVEAALETFMAVLEPILILVMAAAVSFVVAGVLLPIFEMNTMRGF